MTGEETFDEGIAQCFFFTAVELKGDSYRRGRYADFTRVVNKRFPSWPAVVLFKTKNTDLVTIGFIHRRPNQRDSNRDVLGKVSLIREIDPRQPHRAHLDILEELSLRNYFQQAAAGQRNFDGLLAAWLETLNTEELNKRFYRELLDWFKRVVKDADFPDTQEPEEHAVRLITRLLFIWFMKEKGLVAEQLFDERKIAPLLTDYDPQNGDSYYRAVLQNLFFATLNQKIEERKFRDPDAVGERHNDEYRVFTLRRYEDLIEDPNRLCELLDETPFINGGLFDCLDDPEGSNKDEDRIDCFSDNPRHRDQLSVPNWLLFDRRGLFPLLKRYKFTVEENTPIDQEVALDPELLGNVFENLLAHLNPATEKEAKKRKNIGAFYTPRVVVDFIAKEALAAALAERADPDDGDRDFWRERLIYLLDSADPFEDANELFSEKEKSGLAAAVSRLTVIDPAVGSGAFSMAALLKLTMALRRIDPEGSLWAEIQKQRAVEKAENAFEGLSKEERDEELDEVSDVFEIYRDSDYGRKLFLIQNNIFGVDIERIAVHIARLRFFISLAIEQEPGGGPDNNYGIKPLPNLETRFIAADSLGELKILRRKGQGFLIDGDDQVQNLRNQIDGVRERYFHAKTRSGKKRCIRRDAKLREKIAERLTDMRWMDAINADKYVRWNPYSQSDKVPDWFNAETMFGVAGGFDVVIGNPPYVQLQKNRGFLGNRYVKAGFESFTRKGDIYCLFYERALKIAKKETGVAGFITSNKWMRADYGEKLRGLFYRTARPMQLLNLGPDVFDAAVDTNILLMRNSTPSERAAMRVVKMQSDFDRKEGSIDGYMRKNGFSMPVPENGLPWAVLTEAERNILDKIRRIGIPLSAWDVFFRRGVVTGDNDAFIIDTVAKNALIKADSRSEEIIVPVLHGKNVERWLTLHSETPLQRRAPAARSSGALQRRAPAARSSGALQRRAPAARSSGALQRRAPAARSSGALANG